MSSDDKNELPTIPNLDSGLYDLFPSILWFVFACVLVTVAWPHIRTAIESIALRIRSGAAMEIGGFKLDSIRTPVGPNHGDTEIATHLDQSREHDRNNIYGTTKGVFIATKLFPSKDIKQTYDVMLFVIRHKGSLSEVSHVEYYLGASWGHDVFTSRDRGKRFALVASAYGPFLCHARVYFASGSYIDTWRYIDFHTGVIPFLAPDAT